MFPVKTGSDRLRTSTTSTSRGVRTSILSRPLLGTTEPAGTSVATRSFTEPRMLCVGHTYPCPSTSRTATCSRSKLRLPA